MIRNNDPKLKEIKDEVFRDEDFEEDDGNNKNAVKGKKDKKLTYKDQIRMDALKGGASSDEDEDNDDSDNDGNDLFKKRRGNKETMAEEEERLKNEFKKAAKVKDTKNKVKIQDSSDNEEDEEDNDDFLKKKSNDEDEDEEADKIPDNIE